MFTIADIIRTLNNVEVKGKANMDRLLGAIIALEAIDKAQENAKAQDSAKAEDKGD